MKKTDMELQLRAAAYAVVATIIVSLLAPQSVHAQSVATGILNTITREIRGVFMHEVWNWIVGIMFAMSLLAAVITKRGEAIAGAVVTGIIGAYLVQRSELLATFGINLGVGSGP